MAKSSKYFNIKTGTLNLIKEKVEYSLHQIVIGEDFLKGTFLAQAVKSIINIWNLSELK